MPKKKLQSRRRRGVILSLSGWQRLRKAQEQSELQSNGGRPYTLEELNEITGLSPKTLTKVRTRKTPVDRQTLEEYFRNFNLTLTPNDYQQPGVEIKIDRQLVIPIDQDWGEAPDVSVFYDRSEELATLKQWIVSDRDRLVGIVGMGGIGKTALAVKLAQQIQNQFEYVIWRSVRNAPYLETLLGELLSFFSEEQEIEAKIDTLLEYFRDFHCLVILDNLETILLPEKSVGKYRAGYENYGELLELIGETSHSSCLLLTSREKPVEVATLEGIDLSVRSLQLKGSPEAARGLIQAKRLFGSKLQQQQLCDRYSDNPLALKVVATSIQDLFNGEINTFLAQNISVFSNIEQLLEQQFSRLSSLEQSIMYWLAINREWTSISELAEDIIPPVSKAELLGALQSLSWRSLIETQAGSYTQQPVVMEYATARLIKEVACEIIQGSSSLTLFCTYPLIKATAKDYVRESQIRLILEPIAIQLGANFGSSKAIEQQVQKILKLLRSSAIPLSGYGSGNLINLAHHLQIDLSYYDFSGLRIWQAYLQGVNLQQVNFTDADLAKSVFTQTFGSILSLAFSPDGKFLATGDTKGEIHLWQVTPPRSLFTFQGHTHWVLSLAWSPDGKILASSSYEPTIRLWQPSTGECTTTLTGHTNWVLSVAWSPDGTILASGGDDRTVRIWNVTEGKCLKVLTGHTNWIMSVAWSPGDLSLLSRPDGTSGNKTLASASSDRTVRIWDVTEGKCLNTLTGHTNWVRTVAWSFDGNTLASGSDDQTVKLWDVTEGKCLNTLTEHTNWVSSVAWHPNEQILASSSHDRTVKLWNATTGSCMKTLHGHIKWVWSVVWNPDGKTLASGSYDQSVRLWNLSTGQCLKTLQGYTNWVFSVAWSPDGLSPTMGDKSPNGGNILASSSEDRTIKLWNITEERCVKTLSGHTGLVWSVAWSPDGKTIVSGGDDQTARLWNPDTGQCLKTYTGHDGLVWSVAISPNGQFFASGSDDRTVKLWDIKTGQCLLSLEGHSDSVHSVAWSPNGKILASGSYDQTVKLWNSKTGECLFSLHGHENWVRSIAWSPDGQTLASSSSDQNVKLWNVQEGRCLETCSGHKSQVWSVAWSPDSTMLATASEDRTIKLWDVQEGRCLKTCSGHKSQVWSVAWSPNGQTLASSSADETIKLWDVNTGECCKTFRASRPYENMNITDAQGLTESQIANLKALGAIGRKYIVRANKCSLS